MKSWNTSPRIADPWAEASTESSSNVNRWNDASSVKSVHKSQQWLRLNVHMSVKTFGRTSQVTFVNVATTNLSARLQFSLLWVIYRPVCAFSPG